MNKVLFSSLKRRLKRGADSYRRLTTRFAHTIRWLSGAMSVLTFIASLMCLVVMIVYVGFDHGAKDTRTIFALLKICRTIFAACILFHIALRFRDTMRTTRWLKWVVDAGILLSLLPALYPHPENPWLPWLEQILYSRKFFLITLGAYALFDVCYGVMRVTARRTNPSLLLAASFLFFIAIGSLVLMMPKCTYHGIGYADSLFVSTSAVCICGLTPVDIATTFTPLGQTALLVMFEIGGLGIITFTSFFAIFFSGTQSIYNQLLVRDVIYSKTMNALIPTLLYILTFTLCIQVIGAVAIFFTLPEAVAPAVNDRIWIAVFHSVSGFCNVGFSNIEGGMGNPILMQNGCSLYLVMSVLVFAGAIGFPILSNFKDAVTVHARRFYERLTHRPRTSAPVHLYDLNTKLVLGTTLTVFAISALLFYVLESNHSMASMSESERFVQSVFNAVMPRSGGFSTISPAAFLNVTLFLVMIQMWIGGASQSMAGGIKVNTFATLLLNVRSVVRQTKGVAAYRRRISIPSVRRANAVVSLSLIATAIFATLLMLLDPQISMKSIIFEAVSATFNVGSSLGATAQLSVPSEAVLCVSMFLGRVGLISLLTGMLTTRRDPSLHYPTENVIIS